MTRQAVDPLGEQVDFSPCASPARQIHQGRFVRLQPVHAANDEDALYKAVAGSGGEAVWDYLPYGPFPTVAAMRSRLDECVASSDPLYFTLVNLETGKQSGIASFMRMDPQMGVIEIGHIWMAPSLQKTRAATEAIYLMMDHVLTKLGYRRLEWKCNALNEASRRAAERFGFQYEGTFRQNLIVKGPNRDTAWYSILDSEWPAQRTKFENWLRPENFDAEGQQIRPLSVCG